MQTLAKALALAVAYIEARTDAHTADDDIQALEEIAAELHGAGGMEKQSLRDAMAALGKSELAEELGFND